MPKELKLEEALELVLTPMEVEYVEIDTSKGMEHVEERCAEIEKLIDSDPEWASTHALSLKVPGDARGHIEMCCLTHGKLLARAMLQAEALGWVEAWKEYGRTTVDMIFNTDGLGTRQKRELLNLATEIFRSGAVERLEKEGWMEIIKREAAHEGQH